jgi:hypothetical protein
MSSELSAANKNECIPLSYYQQKMHIDTKNLCEFICLQQKDFHCKHGSPYQTDADKVIVVDESR